MPRDRRVRPLSTASPLLEGHAILWKEVLDNGIFTQDTHISFVKRGDKNNRNLHLPVVLRIPMPDTGDFVETVIGKVVNRRFTSKGFAVRFEVGDSGLTERLQEDVKKFLSTGEVFMTVSTFQNQQVGINSDGTFSHFPVSSIYLYSEEQVSHAEEETKEDPLGNE